MADWLRKGDTMGIGAVGSEVGYYGYSAVGNTKPNESVENENTFGLLASETVDETDEAGNCPKAFTGMSFADLFANPSLKANQIPVVNQIVSSKNPNDGEIYLTYFTDRKITCCHADGTKEWDLNFDEEQYEKVRDFFKNSKSYEWAKEIYSGDNMQMASVKDYWLELFAEKTDK